MDFTFAELKDYLDMRFDEQDKRLDQKLDQKLDARFEAFADKIEAAFMQQIGELRQEMHNNTAAITDTITRLNDYHDRRHDNHGRRLTRLEDRFAS